MLGGHLNYWREYFATYMNVYALGCTPGTNTEVLNENCN